MTYTKTPHLLGNDPGLADDWTLGPEQLAWLGTTLGKATARWRFLCIHHTVGGAAGNEMNSAYGRGGGQAAYVGEQAKVHQLMRDHGVQIFFYGHDHVFTDMIVDGIHYTLPGSAGAIWAFSQYETGYVQSWPDPGGGKVTVGPDRVSVQLISIDGTVLHQYALPP
jgi:3',5'-cyclic AMP phosphodiesterase CpdA